jgi:hypothetical protein
MISDGAKDVVVIRVFFGIFIVPIATEVKSADSFMVTICFFFGVVSVIF